VNDAEVFTRFHEAWTAGDLPTVLELADPDIVVRPVHRIMFTQSEFRGHDGLVQWYEEMTGPWDSFETLVEEVHLRGDQLVGFVHLVAYADDQALDARVASICEVRDERIVSLIARDIWDVKDELAAQVAR
jgi:ketosteroid isomerase-like protein